MSSLTRRPADYPGNGRRVDASVRRAAKVPRKAARAARRLLVWDRPTTSALARGLETADCGPSVRLVPHEWGRTFIGATLGGGDPLMVRFPVPLEPGDRILLGAGLDIMPEVLAAELLDRDAEYVASERLVLLAAVQHALTGVGYVRLLSPPLTSSDAARLLSPHGQRRLLVDAGFRVPEVRAGNDTSLNQYGRSIRAVPADFIGLDMAQTDGRRRRITRYLPQRHLLLPRGGRQWLLTVIGRHVHAARFDDTRSQSDPEPVAARAPLYKRARAAAALARTSIAEILMVKHGREWLALSMVRSLGMLAPAHHMPFLLNVLTESVGVPPVKQRAAGAVA